MTFVDRYKIFDNLTINDSCDSAPGSLAAAQTRRWASHRPTQGSIQFQNPTIFLFFCVDQKCQQLINIHPGYLPLRRQDGCNSGLVHPSNTFRQTGQGNLLLFVHQDRLQLLSPDGPCESRSSMWDALVQLNPAEGWCYSPNQSTEDSHFVESHHFLSIINNISQLSTVLFELHCKDLEKSACKKGQSKTASVLGWKRNCGWVTVYWLPCIWAAWVQIPVCLLRSVKSDCLPTCTAERSFPWGLEAMCHAPNAYCYPTKLYVKSISSESCALWKFWSCMANTF